MTSWEKDEWDGYTFYFTDGSFFCDECAQSEKASPSPKAGDLIFCKAVYNPTQSDQFLFWELSFAVVTETETIPANEASVTRYGKNLWDNANSYFSSSTAITRTETGFVFDRSKITAGQYVSNTIPMKKGVTYHFYANTLQSASAAQLYLYADKVYGTVLKSVSAGNKILTYTADADYPTARFVYIISSSTPSITVENIMVYVGEKNNDYEPYKEPATFTADEQGNGAVTSLAPTTTLIADSGVSLSAEYHRDINKAFAKLEERITSLTASNTLAQSVTLTGGDQLLQEELTQQELLTNPNPSVTE